MENREYSSRKRLFPAALFTAPVASKTLMSRQTEAFIIVAPFG
ncbi:hypothetical protein ACFL6P_04665 [Candidatus Latescibacterota bacterium]